MVPASGANPASAIEGMGKAAARSFAAPKEDASMLALVAGRGVDDGAVIDIVAVAVVVAAAAAAAAVSASACEATAAAVGIIWPVDAIGCAAGKWSPEVCWSSGEEAQGGQRF